MGLYCGADWSGSSPASVIRGPGAILGALPYRGLDAELIVLCLFLKQCLTLSE